MADAITGNTQLSTTKRDLIAAVVQKELKFQAKLLQWFEDMSQFAAPGAKQVSFPKLTSFTVVDRASAVAGDATVLTSAVDTMLLDINAYVAWIIDSSDAIQSAIPAQLEFAKRAASAHGRYVDEQIILELEAVGNPTTTAAAVITRDVILEMRQELLERNADMSKLVLLVPPTQESAMLKIDEFTHAEIYGSSAIPAGVIGRVYGVPVVVHNGLGATQYFMGEKSGLAVAFQQAPNTSSQPANEYGSNAVRTAMDQLFGVQGLQLGVNGVGATESALIVKDNN